MKNLNQRRIWWLLAVVILIGGAIISRFFALQILEYNFYSALAQSQHEIYKELFPERGEIFIQDLGALKQNNQNRYYPIAINKEFQQVYLVPKDISEETKGKSAEDLARLLDLDKETILERMNKKEDPYEPLKHKVSSETARQIEALNINGVKLAPENWRFYPYGEITAHLTGFVGAADEKKIGQYGLEEYYNNELKGSPGLLIGGKDVAGYWIPSLNQQFKSAQNGDQLILTIDQNIQFKAAKELKQAVEHWQAEEGTIIVMEPETGAIRAMANWPSFDPNEYNKVENIKLFLNPSIQEIYEPGSVFKPITMAAGLDSQKVKPETTYEDKGVVMIKNTAIRNADEKKYGQSTMIQVLEKSINTGAVFVQQKLGSSAFRDYVRKFGFGEPTQIDLTSELAGDISNLYSNREINFATASFGQGIGVTPLQLISAISAIANQGKLMRPFLVEKIKKIDGEEITTETKTVRQVISPESADDLVRMMVNVVENGHAKAARVSGYDIAGKTGTAQVPDPEKGGYSDKTIHTFVGFAPAFDPQFIILIKLNNPQGIRFAESSVVPVFKNLAEYLFNYLEIPPSK